MTNKDYNDDMATRFLVPVMWIGFAFPIIISILANAPHLALIGMILTNVVLVMGYKMSALLEQRDKKMPELTYVPPQPPQPPQPSQPLVGQIKTVTGFGTTTFQVYDGTSWLSITPDLHIRSLMMDKIVRYKRKLLSAVYDNCSEEVKLKLQHHYMGEPNDVMDNKLDETIMLIEVIAGKQY